MLYDVLRGTGRSFFVCIFVEFLHRLFIIMEISYLLLIVTCLLYGMSTLITEWDDFGFKLVNVLVIIAIIVLTLITAEDGFISDRSDYWWLNYLIPVPAVFVGVYISSSIDNDDWYRVFAILGAIGLIATIICTCCCI